MSIHAWFREDYFYNQIGGRESCRRVESFPIRPRFGVELRQLNLKSISVMDIFEIRKLLALHGLLVFRDQSLDDNDLLRFSKLIGSGKVEASARKVSHGKIEKDVAYLTNLQSQDGLPIGFGGDDTDFWHSDQEFRENPASVSILFCLIPAEQGGATSFATTAVRNLGIDEMELAQLRKLWSTRRPATTHDNAPQVTVSHPVIVSNPFTGREYVYVSENTLNFSGMDVESGLALRAILLNEILIEENIYTHEWKPGDLLLYDNVQLLHRREEFRGIRFLKALKIRPDGYCVAAPSGNVVSG